MSMICTFRCFCISLSVCFCFSICLSLYPGPFSSRYNLLKIKDLNDVILTAETPGQNLLYIYVNMYPINIIEKQNDILLPSIFPDVHARYHNLLRHAVRYFMCAATSLRGMQPHWYNYAVYYVCIDLLCQLRNSNIATAISGHIFDGSKL